MYFWVPLYGNGALGLSIFSFAQHVVFTTLSDPDVVDNPSVLCEEFIKGFDQLELIIMGENFGNDITDTSVVEKTEKTLETAKERELQRRNSRAVILPEDIRKSIQEAKKKNSSRSKNQQNVAKTMNNSTGTAVTTNRGGDRGAANVVPIEG